MVGWDGREQKVGSAEQQLRLWHIGLYRVRRPVGELPFWVFSAPMIWRRRVGADFSALFGFGPKPGGFVVQKRNETPETLSVDVRIAFL